MFMEMEEECFCWELIIDMGKDKFLLEEDVLKWDIEELFEEVGNLFCGYWVWMLMIWL